MCVLKMKFLPSAVQKLSSEQTDRQMDRQIDRQKDGQTDTHTDRQTRLKLLPTAYADGKKLLIVPKRLSNCFGFVPRLTALCGFQILFCFLGLTHIKISLYL